MANFLPNLTPAQRQERAQEKRAALLVHLRKHSCITSALAGRLWGLKSRNATWTTLQAASRDGLIEAKQLHGIEIFVPTHHGLAWTIGEGEGLPDLPPPLPEAPADLERLLDVQRVALTVEAAHWEWTPGHLLQSPADGFIGTEAVFVDRKFLDRGAYVSRLAALRASWVREVLWIMPTRPLTNKLAGFLQPLGEGLAQTFCALPEIEDRFPPQAPRGWMGKD